MLIPERFKRQTHAGHQMWGWYDNGPEVGLGQRGGSEVSGQKWINKDLGVSILGAWERKFHGEKTVWKEHEFR